MSASRTGRRPLVSLRRAILLAAIAGIVPVAMAAALAEWAFVREAERSAATKTIEVTHIAASAIQVELQQSLSALRGLALSPLLDTNELDRFALLLQRFVDDMPGWTSASLAQADRRVLFRTDAASPALVYDQESFDRAVRERAAVVGRLLRRADGRWGIAVRVPVLRDGKLLYVLSAIQTPDSMLRILRRQDMPDDWTMSVFDVDNRRVARSREHEANLGGAPAPSLRRLMTSPDLVGSGVTQTLEGTTGYTAYVRLPDFGWTVAVTIPRSTVIAELARPTALSVMGILLAIVLAILSAAYVARRIAEPIAELSEAASQMGAGEVPSPPRTGIDEIASLGASLVAAAETRRRIEAERAQVADERNALLESERAARENAMRMGQLKDQFLATLSHELRTPLNSILGWAQILRHAGTSDKDRDKGLETIERNARAQVKLIEDLLDVSRITSGKLVLDLQMLQPAVVVRSAVENARPAAVAKGLTLHEQVDPAAGPVSADPARLEQIMGNLLGNAIKFTPRGGRIEVSLKGVADRVEIVVADTGDGIDAQFLPFVFERFRQADASTTRQHSGLGLGLSIVRDLVNLHGGAVRAESAGLRQGAKFVVELPLANLQPDLTSPQAPYEGGRPDLAGLRVLIVDDEPDARALAARILEDCGAGVMACDSADAALAAIESFRPHVLVSDISMPHVDGYELLKRLRARDDTRELPAVAVTAFARYEDREQVLAAGFSAHIAKPLEPTVLAETVRRLAPAVRSSEATA
jgi:signal transduction histidine kinase/ActR/RegA family two-component response regulator